MAKRKAPIKAKKIKLFDSEEKTMNNENSNANTPPVIATEEIQPAITANKVISTPKQSIKAVLSPLRNEDEEKVIASLLNDVVGLKPARSNQVLTVFWKGKDTRLPEVQKDCKMHFVWNKKNKSQDYGTAKFAEGARIVSKKAFTLSDGYRLVTTGSDVTPDQDFFSNGDLILTYISKEEWTKERCKRAIKNNRKTADLMKENTEKYKKSSVYLENGNVEKAIEAVSTRELLNRLDSGDLNAVNDSLNDGFSSTIVKI